jgi:hypothetical protein
MVLLGHDIVLVGTLAELGVEHTNSSDGTRYSKYDFHLVDVSSLGSLVMPSEIDAWLIRGGEYWPKWRVDKTYPRNLQQGKRYCIVVRETEDGYVIPNGANGVFEIEDDGTLLFAGRRPIALNVNQVRTEREAQR